LHSPIHVTVTDTGFVTLTVREIFEE
jgi:hypothetical protein